MKERIYNFLMIVIVIAIIIVSVLIILKYTQSQMNEKEIEDVLTQIENKIEQEIPQNNMEEKIEAQYKGNNIIGIIKIDKINLEYPILEETTNQTMKISITKFFGKGVNEIGNLSLAGHNNYDGTMFGRTKELEIGDIIELKDLNGGKKQYSIYQKFDTDPNNISIIEQDEYGTREITLITCTNGNKERLIIKAREINEL